MGGIAISGGRGTLVGTLLGVALLGTIGPALTFLGTQRVLGEGDPGRDHPGCAVASDALPSRLAEAAVPRRDPTAPAASARGVRGAHTHEIAAARPGAGGDVRLRARSASNFLTAGNAAEVARLSVEIGLLALALTPVILTGGIDLSVGSLLGLRRGHAGGVLGATPACRSRPRPSRPSRWASAGACSTRR